MKFEETIVDVVLPCLNEAAALPGVLAAFPAGYRAVVVDNGSTDGSIEVALRCVRRSGSGSAPVRRTWWWAALRGSSCVLELAGGERMTLHAAPDTLDDLLLARCRGRTLDVGCGPGRLVAALARRGVPTLGADVSPVAVALTRRRGAPAFAARRLEPPRSGTRLRT